MTTETPKVKFEAPGKADTSGSSSDNSKEKHKGSNTTTISSRKSNKKKQAENNRLRFRGAEERLNGHAYQVDGEAGKKPNQFKKTTNQLWQLVMRE